MMLKTYINFGLEHIMDLSGADHMAFLAVMSAPFLLKDWKRLLLMATAFTVGHSITLILSALGWIRFNAEIIETLIPITIISAALFSFFTQAHGEKYSNISYLIIAVFGTIHGMGFSTFFGNLLGQEDSILLPLLYFNIGVEIGQIIILLVLMITTQFTISILRVDASRWTNFILGLGSGMALHILLT